MTEPNQTQAPSPAPQEKPRKRRIGRVVLFVSLALNLLVAGLVLGAVVHDHRDRDRNPALRHLGFGPFVDALPRSDRRALLLSMRREAGSFRENRAALRQLFEEFLVVLRDESFDADRVRDLIRAQRDHIGSRQALGEDLLLERLQMMSPEQRAAYADRLEKKLRKRGKAPGPSGGDYERHD